MRNFFHSSSNEWLRYIFEQAITYNSSKELINYIQNNTDKSQTYELVLTDSLASYSFPDEDFCLFKYFPGKRAIATVLNYKNEENMLKRYQEKKTLTMKLLEHNSQLITNYS